MFPSYFYPVIDRAPHPGFSKIKILPSLLSYEASTTLSKLSLPLLLLGPPSPSPRPHYKDGPSFAYSSCTFPSLLEDDPRVF